MGLELKVIFPEKIVTEVIESHKYMMEAQIIDFQVQINVDKLFMDESRLRIILNNLISNSIKYHDPTKENQFVKVEMRRYIDTIILSVEDNGIGIKEEYQKRVFDMFFVTESKNKGSGLGLYMLSDVLGKIEGKVELQSKWKEGTRFVITWKDFKEL